MAQIVIEIPDEVVNRVLNAFAARYGWEQGNPDHGTKAQFAKKQVIQFVKSTVNNYEVQQASTAASNAVEEEVVIS